MTMNGELTVDYVHGRTLALQAQVDELKRETSGVPKLTAEVRNLAHQVRSLGQAVGLRTQTPLPDDWEDITQVRRPELHQLRSRAEDAEQRAGQLEQLARKRPIYGGVLVGLGWAIVELIKAIAAGRITFH